MIPFIVLLENDGERDFLIGLYEHYFAFIKKKITNSIPSEDVEDCIQDCFVRLINNVDKLQKLLSPQITLYIMHTIQSVIVDYRRKRKLLIIDYDIYDVPDQAIQSSVEREIEDKNMYEQFLADFHNLPEIDQIILRCLYQQDMDRNELAQKLGIKPSSIRTYISRAKKHAIQLMRGEFHEK